MADSECDLETDGLDLALKTLCTTHCKDEASLNSKEYCSAFCELVEEYTGQWQVPLPQLKVLRTALCSFTKATAAFPDDCQHIHFVLSSLALSFFELLLFFSKEEYGEQPLKYIFDSLLECHSQLLRHRNIYLHHVKLTIKSGGPWENAVLKRILKEEEIPQKEVEEYLSSELPILLELRVRYMQACERLQEAMALSKCCLENQEMGKHLFFHQAYLTCLYKASLHDHLLKEMAEIDGRDAVEIICNTESVEKDELLLSLCKTFLTQQLHNGDMYYIWDLVFIWSRLYLRAHPSKQEFLSECLSLTSSANNVRALFPFIKLVHTELGDEGIQVCVELCAKALQLCDLLSDAVTRSLVCKTIAFLLPHDLEMCRACALLVFCQERSLEAYRTVCSLYKHPDNELHPNNSPVRTCIRFHILQKLKEHLSFDPEFWNLLTLRTHCLELISDKAMQAAVLIEMEEEEKYCEALSAYNSINELSTEEAECVKPSEHTDSVNGLKDITHGQKVKPLTETENVPKRRRGRRRKEEIQKVKVAEEVVDRADDPEVVYNIKPSKVGKSNAYALRHNHKNRENAAPIKFPLNRKREYLTRCVKSQLLTRKGHKRWLQGVQTLDREEYLKVKKILYKGKKRGRKPFYRVELSFPDNEIQLILQTTSREDTIATPDTLSEEEAFPSEPIHDETSQAKDTAEEQSGDSQTEPENRVSTEEPVRVPAVEGDPELDGPPYDMMDSAVEVFHNYCLNSDADEDEQTQESKRSKETAKPKEFTKPKEATKPKNTTKLQESGKTKHASKAAEEPNENKDVESGDTEETKSEVKGKLTWQERSIRTQKYNHIVHSCKLCNKIYRGLNVLRHALSHMKKKRKICILCGQRFKEFSEASKHVEEHIEEMSQNKSSDDDGKVFYENKINDDNEVNDNIKMSENCVNDVDKPSDETIDELPVTDSDTTQQTPTTNGTETPTPPALPEESPKPAVNEEPKPNPKRKPCRFKFTELKREERIVRHARCLFKKSYLFSKNNHYIFPCDYNLTDDQVVIEGDLVILKNVPVRENGANGENKKVKTLEKEEKEAEKTVNWENEMLETSEKELENTDANRNNERLDTMENNEPEREETETHREIEKMATLEKEEDKTAEPLSTLLDKGEETESTSEKEVECKEEEKFVCKDLVYYLCPGEGCDKVFFKLGHTMTKHAMKYHLSEERVQEKIFEWTKQKCILCSRQIEFIQHFKGHMKLHVEHPQFFCYHQDCGQRFASTNELRTHESQHFPLRPQCKYTACESVFNNMVGLNDHEWRHYVPTPLKSDFELGPNKHKRHNDEAPWKQRVKVEELWLQNKNCPRESITLREVAADGLNNSKNSDDLDLPNEEANVKIINGFCEKTDLVTHTSKEPGGKKKEQLEIEPIDVKNRTENTILTSECEPSVEEPVIEPHKAFKPAYKSVFKALVRPPPSMYMTESELSMRKRKSGEIESPPVKKYQYTPKKQPSEKPGVTQPKAEPETKIRHRCEKCLSFFTSPEELEKHKSLNTCSALFGFDSDDES